MKHLFILIVSVVFLTCFNQSSYSADAVKIAIVDMQKLQEKSKSFQKAKEELEKKAAPLKKQLDGEKSDIDKLEEELEKQSMMLSFDAREDKYKNLEKKKRHYKYILDEFLRELKEEELEATKKVGNDIKKVVDKIALKQGYTVVFEKRAVGLLYNIDDIDITDQVINAFDK